jgi:transposase
VIADPAALPDDVDSLKRLVIEALAALKTKTLEIETLKVQLMRLRRMQFGRSSEKLAGEIAQLELALEELEGSAAEMLEPIAEQPVAEQPAAEPPARKPARRALPDHLPREEVVHAPPASCPSCGGALRPLGEDSSEVLEYVPGHFKVIRHVRPKLSCRCCETIQQAPSPDLPIDRGRPGPGLLAHLLMSKYGAHLPLYRQAEIFARGGVELSRSTLAGWVGQAAFALRPLVDAIAAHVLSADKIHADDTPVPVLAPGTGKTKTGRLWVYVRDDRPSGGPAPPATLYRYSPDRRGEHPRDHLAGFTGHLQADGYAGFNELYRQNAITEVACWAHVRRKFFDFHAATKSPLAAEALQQIGALYDVERQLGGCPADIRRAVRGRLAGPRLDAFKGWLEATLRRVSAKSDLAGAIRYALKHWTQLTRYRDDGRLEIDNNAAERAIRPLALGRKNYLFAGSDDGGRRAAAIYSLIETAKMNGVDPEAWLRDVLARLATHPAKRVGELLPWAWGPKRLSEQIAA